VGVARAHAWVAAATVAAAIAYGGKPPAIGAQSPVVPSPRQVIATRDVKHDTSPPFRLIPPSGTASRPHPALHPEAPVAAALSAPDTSGQSADTLTRIPTPTVNFAGISSDGSAPPDNDGAAGPSQYLELVNSQIAVYSKSGATLLAQRATNTLWSGFGGGCQANNDGDGTVLFDTMSQRWVLQQFSVFTLPYLECVAVSTSSDATGAWHRYAFLTPDQDSSGNGFPDYPKMGVWRDGYYASYNLFNAAGTIGEGTLLCAYERAAMVSGTVAGQQCFVATALPEKTALPATVDGSRAPPSGGPEWFVGLSPTTTGSLAYYRFHVDFRAPANSSLLGPTDLPVQAFSEACGGIGSCIPQVDTTQGLDSLGDRLMYRLAYRKGHGDDDLPQGQSSSMGKR
jgi:hypothetical protein